MTPTWLLRAKEWLKWSLVSIGYHLIPRTRSPRGQQACGVNLIGYAHAEMGLGEALRNTALALEYANVPFLVRKVDVPLLNRQDNLSMQQFMADHCRYGINCIGINPDLLYRLPQWLPYDEWGRRYNVGYWFWELANFPGAWRYACNLVDEVWVNTEFVANAVRQVHDRVYKIPFAIEFETPDSKFERQYFKLPTSGFLFLFSYDFNSSAVRKNPDAVIEAFRHAFPETTSNVCLVVKSINGEQNSVALTRLKSSLGNDPRIIWVDGYLSTDEMRGLLNIADAYVSLHRSEGLGLGMAESMYLGKPVIATNYSGNTEFMHEDNSCLVPCTMVPVKAFEYPHHENQLWASPNIAAAAAWMQRLVYEPGLANSIGASARSYMHEHHSRAVMSQAVRDRVAEIGALT